MKFKCLLSALLLITSAIGFAAVFDYPNNKAPAISLPEAFEITKAMMKSQGDERRYHYVSASLGGDASQTGDGYWELELYDASGNLLEARIPLQDLDCSLFYHHEKGEYRLIEFSRTGTKVAVAAKERNGKAK